VIAQELLDALNNLQNTTKLDQNAIWALSEYLKDTWKDDLGQTVRPFNLGKALSGFFVDISQHLLSPKIIQHTPEMEAILLKTFGATDGSLSRFWAKSAEILKRALEPYPSYSNEFQSYFDLLLQSSLEGKPSASPAVSPFGSQRSSSQPSTETTPSRPLVLAVKTDTPAISIAPAPEKVPVTMPKPEPEPKTTPKNAYLVLQGTRVIPLNQSLIKIGRQLDNHIILEDPRVSRSHAQLKWINDHFVIFDLNSTGGTFINGQRTGQSVLYPGDVISLAGVKFIYSQELPAKPGEVRIIELGSPFAADRPTAVMRRESIKSASKETSELPKTAPLKK